MNFKYNAHIRPEMQQNIFILHLDTGNHFRSIIEYLQ